MITLSHTELLNSFHELHAEFKKLGSKNNFLKKCNSSLLLENDLFKKQIESLKAKIEEATFPKETANEFDT